MLSGVAQSAWHLPGGPVGPASRWAATSNVEVGQTTYAGNREGQGWRGEKGARDKFTNRRRGKEGVEWGRGQWPLARDGGL